MVPDRAWLEAPVAALSWRSDGQDLRLRRVNETADALTKGAASKFVGCSVDEIFVDAPELVELVERASSACDVRELELDFSSLGMNIHARTRFRAVGLEPGEVLVYALLLGPARSSRVRLGASNEAPRRAAVASLLDRDRVALYVMRIEPSGDFTFVDFNQRSYEYTRGRVVKLLGMTARSLYAHQPHLLELFERARDEGQVERQLLTLRMATTGEVQDFDVTIQREGDYLFLFSEPRVRDDSIEDRLRHVEAQLNRAQRLDSIGRVAGGIAHDFNNLLLAIVTIADLLADQVPGPLAPQVRQILDVATRGASLTNQLLAYASREPLPPQSVSVPEVVEGLAPMLRCLFGQSISIRVEVAPSLPPVFIDPTRLEQLFMNLSVNARDAMAQGGELLIALDRPTPADLVRVDPPLPAGAGCLRVRVVDEGIGIHPELVGSVFEPFVTSKTTGTGLGLATVHDIVREAGGRIFVDSGLDEGTCFTILLPFAEARSVAS